MEKKTNYSIQTLLDSRSFLYVLLFIVTICFVSTYTKIYDVKLDMNGDNIHYYALGKALAEGKGFTNTISFSETPHTHFPPGYPVFVAGVMKFFPDNINAVKIANGILLYAAILLLFFLLKKISKMDKIIGLGNALVDALAIIEDDNILTEMQLPKGSMTLIDEDKFLKISEYFSRMKTHLANGGSAGNAIRAMACLGAGTGFIGKVSNDFYGNFFRDSLLERGTEANLLLSTTLPSGVASTFISPDGERTFGTYLGAASTLKAEDLSLDMFKGYAYLFIEGYLVQDHDMILRAIELAKEAGLQVCLDMASYNIVEGDLEFFSLLVNKYVDIVFANEEEAKAFTGKEPEEALDIIAKMCSIAIVKVGARGSLIRKGTEMVQVQAAPVEKVVDTTGAGDYFAAGFLYGLTCGYSLEKCGKIGSLLSKDVIQVVGTELQAAQWEKIKEEILLIN